MPDNNIKSKLAAISFDRSFINLFNIEGLSRAEKIVHDGADYNEAFSEATRQLREIKYLSYGVFDLDVEVKGGTAPQYDMMCSMRDRDGMYILEINILNKNGEPLAPALEFADFHDEKEFGWLLSRLIDTKNFPLELLHKKLQEEVQFQAGIESAEFPNTPIH